MSQRLLEGSGHRKVLNCYKPLSSLYTIELHGHILQWHPGRDEMLSLQLILMLAGRRLAHAANNNLELVKPFKCKLQVLKYIARKIGFDFINFLLSLLSNLCCISCDEPGFFVCHEKPFMKLLVSIIHHA